MGDIKNYSPQSGRVLKEDNTVINKADILALQVPLDVTFHESTTETSTGDIIEVGGYKTLTVEIYGTSTSRTIAFYGRSTSGENRTLMGVRMSDFAMATGTTETGEIWQFDITGLVSVFMDLQSVDGGTVNIAGRVVA